MFVPAVVPPPGFWGAGLSLPLVVPLTDLFVTGWAVDRDALDAALGLPGGRVPDHPDPVTVPLPAGTRWEDVELVVDARHLRVRAGAVERRVGYAEAGFADRRTGKPSDGWGRLTALAHRGGTLDDGDRVRTKPDAVKAAVAGLRAALRALTGLTADPFHPTRRARPYRARFAVRPAGPFTIPVPDGLTWDDVTIGVGVDGGVTVRFAVTAVDVVRVPGDDGGPGRWDAAAAAGERSLTVPPPALGLTAEARDALDDLARGRGRARRGPADRGMTSLAGALTRLLPIAGSGLVHAADGWRARFEVETLGRAADR